MEYRVYYNNSTDPQRWSVDEGTSETEITVRGVSFERVEAVSMTRDDGPEPRAWFQVESCTVSVEAGIARFRDY